MFNWYFTLNKYNIYHSDWKDHNILIFQDDFYNFDKYYKLKLCDFGNAVDEWQKITGWTKQYCDLNIFKIDN